jgi:hypothetical protein
VSAHAPGHATYSRTWLATATCHDQPNLFLDVLDPHSESISQPPAFNGRGTHGVPMLVGPNWSISNRSRSQLASIRGFMGGRIY